MGDDGARYRGLSLWLDTVGESLAPRPPLAGDTQVDVAIVGAGYTGLWTAYYLSRADPSLRVVVVEAEVAGFGASGRNGGWCSALFPVGKERIARRHGRDAALAMYRGLEDAVDEVGAVATAEGIDVSWAKGGAVVLATSTAHVARLRAEVEGERRWARGPDEVGWLDAASAAQLVDAAGVRAATYTPHCAVLHPGRLVRGLARVVTASRVVVAERTLVTELGPGTVVTDHGTVRADIVVRATEGYTPALPRLRRLLVPIYSLVIATEPLPPSFWANVGWRNREALTDAGHLIIYAQRTADDRIVFGGRGAPYHFGSRVRPDFDRSAAVFAALEQRLHELFPGTRGARITHRWGGPLGVARDWHPSVGFDRRAGQAWAGGYVGDGVAAANLAGRTLADLTTGADTALTRLPWVGHQSRRWEPEPLRWLGINAGLRAAASADRVESRTGRPARRAAIVRRLTGH